ncbi:N-acetylglucosamine-6-phosphate deacetylase [Sanguibacter sp. HDW7]|uniref:N-acetylglucosamine-6-phosphate deacetylase n=1 Tax=Sanguibacter sp. HDW7 TaxID=2714931 RepID=UPI001409C071|nr:amidohydrolase family protein [Sanguibacter sp. HDW7]QIK83990.1 amidohydrolase family protein [Sanguibacter sp. HDW7]
MANKVVLRGRVLTGTTEIPDGVVVLDGSRVAFVGDVSAAQTAGHELADARTVPVITPGLVDIHCHGGGGASFPDSEDAETAMTAVLVHRRAGTTSLVASLVTASPETLLARSAVLAGLAEAGELAGVHLEGPFVSVARCGAQDPNLIQEPDAELVRRVGAVLGRHFVTMTLAPEAPGNTGDGGVTEALVEAGALPSYGHTDAAAGEMRAGLDEAFDRLAAPGVRSARPTVTHLFNGMRPLAHREAGPIADCLSAAARGRAVVELVADATHVNPALVRDVVEMVGADNVALVTDAMAAAGMPDGAYRLGSMEVTVADGVARLTVGGAIAGGTARLSDVVRRTVRGGVPLVDAVRAATHTPATVLGRTDIGRLEAGARADVLLLDDELHVLDVLRGGEPVAQS